MTKTQALAGGLNAASVEERAGSLRTRLADVAVVVLLVGAVFAIGLIDPNDQFLSTNDIYIFRQIHTYFDFFSWLPQDVASSEAVLDKVARFVFWVFYYFHGAPPQLYQAPLFAAMDAVKIPFRPFYGQVMVSAYLALTVVLFWSCLRRAGVTKPIAATAALLVACSPMLTGFSRGFGTIWLVNAAFCQVLAVHAFQRLREGRGRWFLGLVLTHIIMSDPISFLIVGPLLVAWLLPDPWQGLGKAGEFVRRRLLMLWSWKIWLLPVMAVVAVLLWNVVRARYAAAIPGEATLFVYPFVKYIAGAVGQTHGGLFGPQDWLRVAVISFGIFAPIGFPILLGAGVFARSNKATDPLLLGWALISSIGFGLMFYVFSYPAMGSQLMPYVGYPVYTILPFATLLALAADRIASGSAWRNHLATACLAVFAAFGLLTTVNYIWQKPLVPGSALLAFDAPGMDFIGLRRPYYGDEAAGAAVRHVLARTVASGKPAARLLYVRKPDNVRFDIFWMYAGLEYGGRWFELHRGAMPKLDARVLEQEAGAKSSEWAMRKIEPVHRTVESTTALHDAQGGSCTAQACVVLDVTGSASDDELLGRLAAAPDLQIRRDDTTAYNISIIGDRSLLPAAGVTDGRALDQGFRASFPSLWDLIPPREPLYFLNQFKRATAHQQ